MFQNFFYKKLFCSCIIFIQARVREEYVTILTGPNTDQNHKHFSQKILTPNYALTSFSVMLTCKPTDSFHISIMMRKCMAIHTYSIYSCCFRKNVKITKLTGVKLYTIVLHKLYYLQFTYIIIYRY